MVRPDGRQNQQLRPVKITTDYTKYAEGSCLIEFGDTKVICTASVEESVPPFLKGSGTGWVTAEYGMLPRSCSTRVARDKNNGRQQEIQRLVGRSLRGVVDMTKMGERSIRIDCDVIQADGGTRTASITGGFVALVAAFQKLRKSGLITTIPITRYVAAISVGIWQDNLILDLAFEEDSKAEMDMNVVMLNSGEFVEIQGTAEGKPFTKAEADELLELAQKGIKELFAFQKKALGGWEPDR